MGFNLFLYINIYKSKLKKGRDSMQALTLLLLTKFGIVTNQFNVSFVVFVTRLH